MSHPVPDEESIFNAARQIAAPEARRAFVDQACASDAAVRARVEALLQVHDTAGSFLAVPAVGPNGTEVPTLRDGPGSMIGPYKLLQQIGEGGFGVVYMAEQTEPVRRKVALKILKPGMGTRQVVARFEAERQALAIMDHANIAKVFDGGQTPFGRPYFVMELVKGTPITEFCDKNHLTTRQRLELFVTVCQAVQHAHQKGIIHRDLKPSNVLVSRHDVTPVVKVIDFGVAKALGQELTEKTLFTSIAQMIGTPLYMSPEQAGMSDLDVDTRSDIYSLGVLLYELLTGATPFEKDRFGKAAFDEIRRIIREEEPSKPSTKLRTAEALPTVAANRGTEPAKLKRLVRGELDWIVMKALEKDRNRRYETANGFALDVQRYLADEPVRACSPSAGYRLRKLVRRNKRSVLAASMVVLALVAGLIGTTWAMVRATHAEAEAVSEAKLKETALTAAQLSERDAKDSLWLSLYEQARARRFSRQMGQRLDSLDVLAKAARLGSDERLRDEAIAAMALPDVRLGPTWHGLPTGYTTAKFDSQYRLYARASDKGIISIRSFPDDREIQNIVYAPTRFGFFLLSRDGRYLANLEAGDTLKVWRVADRAAVLREEPRQTFGWAFSPDSRQLAIGQQGWILRFDLATGKELSRWQLPDKRHAHALAYHPDKRRLAVGYQNSSLASVFDATNGELVANLPIGANQLQVVAWHPDGTHLAVAGSDPDIQIWNVPAKRKVATLQGHAQNVTVLTFHPEGDLLASHSWDGTVRLWDPATGRQLLQFTLGSGRIGFSNDGRWLGFKLRGEQAQLLEVTPTREYHTLVSSLGAGQGGFEDGDISPDGRLLALMKSDAVCLWHLPSGRELAVLPPGRPRFQSDSELLIAGLGGLHRWPIQPGAAANELRLGPPRIIALPAVPTHAARSQDGRTLAIISEVSGTGLLVDLTTDSVRAPRFDHAIADSVALSRDGRWLATRGWHSDCVRLWNAETGKLVREWVLGWHTQAFFTPDSRALIISQGDEFSFWDVATLQPIRRIRRDGSQFPGYVAFSPDGGLMALEMAPGIIHLKDSATDRTVARLEDPLGDRSTWMSFTPDGTQLVVAATYAKAVHVWDLRAIRQRLKGMGLDWDWPEFPPAAAKTNEPSQRYAEPAWKAQVVETDAQRAQSLNKQANELRVMGKPEEAEALCRKAIEIDPKDARTHTSLGLALFDQNKVDEAMVSYKKAIEIDPRYSWAHNSLGGVLHYQKKLDEAIACYRKAIEIDPNHAWAYNNIGVALYEQNKLDEAIACFHKAIEFDSHHTMAHIGLGIVLSKQVKWDEAIVSFRNAIQSMAHTDDRGRRYLSQKLNLAAWQLATASDSKMRNPAAAVELAKEAVRLNPVGNHWNTLGVAHYRAGDHKAAVAALEHSMELRNGGDSLDWFFLAMSRRQMGNEDEAHKWYDKAVEWMEKNQPKNDELRRFRAEAAELLKPKEKK